MQLIQSGQLRLSTQFLIASLPIIGFCTIMIGLWIGAEVKTEITHRLGYENAVYVESFISKRLEFVQGGNELTSESIQALDLLLINTGLGEK